MRWFLISLGFLIISWIFFVASFGFAAPAKAETWSCSYLTVDKEPATMVFSHRRWRWTTGLSKIGLPCNN